MSRALFPFIGADFGGAPDTQKEIPGFSSIIFLFFISAARFLCFLHSPFAVFCSDSRNSLLLTIGISSLFIFGGKFYLFCIRFSLFFRFEDRVTLFFQSPFVAFYCRGKFYRFLHSFLAVSQQSDLIGQSINRTPPISFICSPLGYKTRYPELSSAPTISFPDDNPAGSPENTTVPPAASKPEAPPINPLS